MKEEYPDDPDPWEDNPVEMEECVVDDICETCGGSGLDETDNEDPELCRDCGGTGKS